MRIEGIDAAELASDIYFLDQSGLSTYFTPTAINDNSGMRYMKVSGADNKDLYSILKRINLSDNKYFILRLMRRGDLVSLLQYLSKDKLIEALSLFPRSKLVQFIQILPKNMILKMLLSVMPLRLLLQYFPLEVVFNILRSKKLDVGDMIKGFENMPTEMLQELLGHITGQNMDQMGFPEMLGMLRQLRKEQIIEGMRNLHPKHIFEFVFDVTRRDPNLLETIPRGALMDVIGGFPKPNLMEMFQVLPENLLMEFVSQLQDKLLAVAVSQIDDNIFAAILLNQYPNLLLSLAA